MLTRCPVQRAQISDITMFKVQNFVQILIDPKKLHNFLTINRLIDD